MSNGSELTPYEIDDLEHSNWFWHQSSGEAHSVSKFNPDRDFEAERHYNEGVADGLADSRQEIAQLRAELERVRGEARVAREERDSARASYAKEQRINARYMAEFVKVEKERDAARAAAGAWKRNAKTRYRVEQYVVGKIDSRRQWQETKEHFHEAYND